MSYSFSIGSLSRLVQKILNDSILVIEPETQHGTYVKNILIFELDTLKDFTDCDKFVTLHVTSFKTSFTKSETLTQYVH